MRIRRAGRSAATRAFAVSLAAGLVLAACSESTPTPPPSPTASPSASPAPPASATATPRVTLGPGATLRDLAGNRYFGTAVLASPLAQSLKYTGIVSDQFSSITPETAMTWAAVEPARGDLQWDALDTIVDFAQFHFQKLIGRTLVSDKQLPAWLTLGTFDQATLKQILHDHITAEVGRYAGRVYAWDVVEDAFNDNGSMRNTIWKKILGPDYIAEALQWAYAADPKAKLYITDDDALGLNDKGDALYVLVKSLLDQGIPIDGVGFQAHLDATTGAFPQAIAANLQRFTNLGLEVAITELDVRVHVPPLQAELDRQTSYYTQVIGACLATPGCVGVTVWEFSDRYSWVPAAFPGEGAADLYDSNLNPKPVLTAVRQTLASQP
jgi:endo-1,4-beta-xylanase